MPGTRPQHWLRATIRYVVLAVLAIIAVFGIIGLLLSHFIEYSRFGRWDNAVNRAFVNQRSAGLDDLTGYGTKIVDTFSVIVLTLTTEIALISRRLWRFVIALPVALASELTIFICTSEITRRPRPTVSKLGSIPKTFSFPSGHAAAAVVLFGIIALAVGRNRSRRTRGFACTLASLLVAFVAFSRVYRGMHHTTDVVAGILMGCAAVAVGFGAARTAGQKNSACTPSTVPA